ncbi:MAG TPA: hypothetical protein VLY24_11010 [Bryobacteraceae bacterium]|nr:hypothetical protein [Bryobacteraceae bacterium]
MSRHPSEANLALLAGGELSRWRQWSVARHVAGCAECRREVAEFTGLREEVHVMAETPEVSWNSLAAEMRANIRLGLEAGECVTERPAVHGVFSLRAMVACGSLAMLLAVGFLIEQPAPRTTESKAAEAVLETNGSGIQVTEGSQSMMLLNASSRDVQYQAGGSTMGARYVNSDTGQVTINNVYVQ